MKWSRLLSPPAIVGLLCAIVGSIALAYEARAILIPFWGMAIAALLLILVFVGGKK